MKIYVIADTHIKDSKEDVEKQKKILKLLEKADIIILLGDIFDFWIEYKKVMLKVYFNFLCKIQAEIERGKEVHFVPGNHDFYDTNFLSSMGIIVHENGFSLDLNGMKFFFHHGDTLSKSGRLNRFIFGNAIVKGIFKIIHPDIGLILASFVSKFSRKRSRTGVIKDMYKHIYDLFRDYNVIITAHTHQPCILKREDGIYANPGDWVEHASYLAIENGTISLYNYPNNLIESTTCFKI